jgi:hypothetical protein
VGLGKGPLRLEDFGSSGHKKLLPEEVIVQACFIFAENPTTRFTGEVVVSIISAKIVDQASQEADGR